MTKASACTHELGILHVLEPAQTGGLERVVCSLAAGQADRGHRTRVAAILPGTEDRDSFRSDLRERSVQVTPIHVRPRGYWTEYRRTKTLCEKTAPDVVHTHGYRAGVVDALAAHSAGIPIISTVHGFTAGSPKNRLLEALYRRSLRWYDVAVAVSRPLARQLIQAGVPEEKVEVVQNAWPGGGSLLPRVEARRELGLPPDAFVAGWVGRMSEEKRPELFMDALLRIDQDFVLGCMIGVEPDDLDRSGQARETGNLVPVGLVPNASKYFSAFDVFVLTSKREGTPMVLLEAMAAEVPIVTTRVGGIPDMLSSEEAQLVPHGDPAAIAAAISWVRNNREEAEAQATAARRRLARDFRLSDWLDRYEHLYRRCTHPSGQVS